MLTLLALWKKLKFGKKKMSKILVRTLSILLLISIASCNSWNYSGHNGPEHWGDITEKYKFCKVGFNQSPINVTTNFSEHDLRFSHKDSVVVKKNNKHNATLRFFGDNFVWRGRKQYRLWNINFHHPSEHLVNGKNYSLEMQISYKSDDEQWLKLAVLLEPSDKDNNNFDEMTNFLIEGKKEGKIDSSKLIPQSDKAFFYEGSMTTPPCKEGVKWYVMQEVVNISKEQMQEIIKSTIFVPTNARPVQKFNPEAY